MTLRSSKFSRCIWVVATALMLAMPTASRAYTVEQEEMCSGDAMRLCFSEIPNVDRITACMEQHRLHGAAPRVPERGLQGGVRGDYTRRHHRGSGRRYCSSGARSSGARQTGLKALQTNDPHPEAQARLRESLNLSK
jgi:hypothetical protein